MKRRTWIRGSPTSLFQAPESARAAFFADYEYELLTPCRKRRDMQPMLVSINGKDCKFGLQEHPGEQFIYVLEGSMDYVVGAKTYSVGPGDCLYFDAQMPHRPKLQRNQQARYLVVFSTGYAASGAKIPS